MTRKIDPQGIDISYRSFVELIEYISKLDSEKDLCEAKVIFISPWDA
jgi:hypothetical protein